MCGTRHRPNAITTRLAKGICEDCYDLQYWREKLRTMHPDEDSGLHYSIQKHTRILEQEQKKHIQACPEKTRARTAIQHIAREPA